MRNRRTGNFKEVPLLYYKTREQIEVYLKKPVEQKLRWLEAQMEFFHKAMPPRAKEIRGKLRKPGLRLSIRGASLSKEILKERGQSKK